VSGHAQLLQTQMGLFLTAGMQPLIMPEDPYLVEFSHKLGSAVFFGGSLGVLFSLMAMAASFVPWLKGKFSPYDGVVYLVLGALFTFLGYSGEHPVLSFLFGFLSPAFFFAPWTLIIRRSDPWDLSVKRWLGMALFTAAPLIFLMTLGHSSFDMIRDTMLTMPMTRDLSDFYYDHTLLAAHVIKPFEALEQKVIAVSDGIGQIGPIPHGTLWVVTPDPCGLEGRSLTVSDRELPCGEVVIQDTRPANVNNRIVREYSKAFDRNEWMREGIGIFFFRGPFLLVPVFLMLWFALFLSNLWEKSPGVVLLVLLVYLALFWPAWKNFYEQYGLRSHPEDIARYLLSEHEEMRYLALATFPEQFTDRELMRFSRDSSPRIRIRSLLEAGHRRSPKFLEVYAGGLKDPQLNVRTRACMALGGLHSERAADLLEQAFLHDTSWYVRMYAFQALGKSRPMARIIKVGKLP
jgi:hypothetical protein